jgi:hypothetical protein
MACGGSRLLGACNEGQPRRFTVSHGATGNALDLCSNRSVGRGHHLMQAGVKGSSPLAPPGKTPSWLPALVLSGPVRSSPLTRAELLADSRVACVQATSCQRRPRTSPRRTPYSISRTSAAKSRIKLPVMNFQCKLEADARDQPPSGQYPGGHPRESKPCSSSFWSSSSSSPRRSCCAAATTSRQTALTRRAQGHRSRTSSPDREACQATRHCPCRGKRKIMTAIKGARAAPHQRTPPRNGLPEPVPYVYGQQTRRNTYAARIARRNIQGWWQPPAACPAQGH